MDLSHIVLLAAGLSLLYLIIFHPREYMTVKDIQEKQKFHENKPTNSDLNKVSPTPNSTSKKTTQRGNAILGPEVPPLDVNAPTPTTGSGKNGTGVYPDIYGPEVLKAPGSKDHGGDSSEPPPYDYVPAAEFPAGPAEPAPYLNDFSKILKT